MTQTRRDEWMKSRGTRPTAFTPNKHTQSRVAFMGISIRQRKCGIATQCVNASFYFLPLPRPPLILSWTQVWLGLYEKVFTTKSPKQLTAPHDAERTSEHSRLRKGSVHAGLVPKKESHHLVHGRCRRWVRRWSVYRNRAHKPSVSPHSARMDAVVGYGLGNVRGSLPYKVYIGWRRIRSYDGTSRVSSGNKMRTVFSSSFFAIDYEWPIH